MKLVHVTEAHSCTNMAGKKFGLLVVSKVEWEVFTLGKKKKKTILVGMRAWRQQVRGGDSIAYEDPSFLLPSRPSL